MVFQGAAAEWRGFEESSDRIAGFLSFLRLSEIRSDDSLAELDPRSTEREPRTKQTRHEPSQIENTHYYSLYLPFINNMAGEQNEKKKWLNLYDWARHDEETGEAAQEVDSEEKEASKRTGLSKYD